MGNHGRARRIGELWLRLAPFELWLVLGPLFRGVAFRLDARLAARRRRRSGRELDPWRWGRRAWRATLCWTPRLGPGRSGAATPGGSVRARSGRNTSGRT